MYCAECGTQIVEGSNFCQKCGAAITQLEAQPQSGQLVIKTRTDSFSVLAIILGILGFFFGPLSIGAIVFGALGISKTGRDSNARGRGIAIVGLVLGIVIVVGWIAFIIFWVFDLWPPLVSLLLPTIA